MLSGILVDLVPFGDAYVEKIPAWDNGPAGFWGNAGDYTFLTQSDHKRRVQEWREEAEKRDFLGVDFGIQTKDGKPIGMMGTNYVWPVHRAAEIGAQIGEPDYWGGGYGTDALTLFIDYMFDWMDLRKIWLGTMSINVRVMRQMEKVGFKLEGQRRSTFLADGVWHDHMEYGLLREEWPGREAVIARLGLQAR
jgi:RimJ/RimL family protein N-acetyltransferase